MDRSQQNMPPALRVRAWLSFILGALALTALGGTTLMGSAAPTEPPGHAISAAAQDAADADDLEAEDEGEKAGHAVENHGRCVSYWNHRAKEAGLKGKAKADFKRPIAQDPDALASKDEPTDSCRFGGALTEAVEAQPDAPGKSDEAKARKLERPDKPEGAPDADDSPEEDETNPLM